MFKTKFRDHVEMNEFFEAGRNHLGYSTYIFARACQVKQEAIESIVRNRNNRLTKSAQDKILNYLEQNGVTKELLNTGIPAEQFEGFAEWLEA